MNDDHRILLEENIWATELDPDSINNLSWLLDENQRQAATLRDLIEDLDTGDIDNKEHLEKAIIYQARKHASWVNTVNIVLGTRANQSNVASGE